MTEITGEKAAMWGPSIVGFGAYQGPAGDDAMDEMLKRLGTHSMGKSCLYLKRLSDVDARAVRQLVRKSTAEVRKRYTSQLGDS